MKICILNYVIKSHFALHRSQTKCNHVCGCNNNKDLMVIERKIICKTVQERGRQQLMEPNDLT